MECINWRRFSAILSGLVPELKDVPIKQLHNPPADLREQYGYPQPVVDYKQARKDAIAAFKDLPKD